MHAKQVGVGIALLGAAVSHSLAGEVDLGTVTLSNGNQAGSVNFVYDDAASTLEICISNVMTANHNPSWLCGLFFDFEGADIASYAGLGDAADMITLNGTTQTPYNDVTADHFWAYNTGLSGSLPFGDMDYGLGAAGYGVFGPGDILNFQVGGPTPQPDGSDGGIVGDYAGLEVPNGHEDTPFVLGELCLIFNLENVDEEALGFGNVAFVFGTDFNEIVLIPLPSAGLLGMVGIGALLTHRRRAE